MAALNDDQNDGAFKRRRPRPITDYGSSMVYWMNQRRPAYKGTQYFAQERPSQSYVVDVLPPAARKDSPAESVPVRHLHTSLGKSKKPVTVVRWMPEGRRLLAGVHNGEFMLWNGMSFNFETVTAMGSSSLRAAEWSTRKEWLVAANDEGIVYYLQPTLNNPHQFKGHDASIRDLAFAPTDSKFVTASDDNTLKIWDFTSSLNESTFTDHGWDVKACDWHPTKGLIVSGSKDHSVRLWDPRTCRSLTKLHGHKNAITATVFSRLRDQLLATAGRDGQTRIFDMRMMRDVAVLRGHDKGVTTLSWHPIHPSLISTGGDDGALHSYLLSEPNTPSGVTTATTSPYASSDPRSAPPQSIYPAHRIPYAHESAIWSLDWHPIGHILASGSNDHFTRFWSRSLPGQSNCFQDQFHLGEEGAEARGTFDRRSGRKQAKEQEEQEEEDEAEGLEDQTLQQQQNQSNPFSIPGLPLPGINMQSSTGISMPGLGNLPPPPPIPIHPPGQSNFPQNSFPPIPTSITNSSSGFGLPPPLPLAPPPSTFQNGSLPGITPESFQQFLANHSRPQPQSQSQSQSLPSSIHLPLPPPPGYPIHHLPLPPPTQSSSSSSNTGIPGLGSNGFNGGIPNDNMMQGYINNNDENNNSLIRKRGPLPSQQEGFKAEQARGNFRVAR